LKNFMPTTNVSGKKFSIYLPLEKKGRKAFFVVEDLEGIDSIEGTEVITIGSLVLKLHLLDLTAMLLQSATPQEFVEELIGEEIVHEVLGPPLKIEGKTAEESHKAEIQAIRKAVELWLQAPVNKKVPFLPENAPKELHEKYSKLSPKKRFLLFASDTVHDRGDYILPASNIDFAPYRMFVPDSVEFLRYCLMIRQKEFSTEIVPYSKPPKKPITWAIEIEGTPYVIKDLFFIENYSRSIGYCYSSRWILPLVWAEILYCVQNNIPAQFCKTCGSLFVAESPTQDYRQVYCSPECRKKAKKNDPSQEKEAQRLYKAFLRGKISAEEYVKLARKKGLRIIGGKHKDSKIKPFLKNSSA